MKHYVKFDVLVNDLRERLSEYLYDMGYKSNPNIIGSVRCINTEEHTHGDQNPSAVIYDNGGKYNIKCHKCGWYGDIFDAYAKLNGFGENSRGFFLRAVKGLCEHFNLDVSDVKFPTMKEYIDDGEDGLESTIYKHTRFLLEKELKEMSTNELKYQHNILSKMRSFDSDDLIYHGVYCSDYSELIKRMSKYSDLGLSEAVMARSLGMIKDDDLDESGRHYKNAEIRKKGHWKLSNLFDSDSLIFTIKGADGNVIGFTRRYMGDDDYKLNKIKYYNSSFSKSSALYLEDEAYRTIRSKRSIFITEGPFDAVRLHSIGIKNAVSVMGSQLNIDLFKFILDYYSLDKIVVAFDGDIAGVDATASFIDKVVNLEEMKGVELHVFNGLGQYKDMDELISAKLDADISKADIRKYILNEMSVHWIVWKTIAAVINAKESEYQNIAYAMSKLVGKHIIDVAYQREVLDHVALLTNMKDEITVLARIAESENLMEQYSKRDKVLDVLDDLVKMRYKARETDVSQLITELQTKLDDASKVLNSNKNKLTPERMQQSNLNDLKEVFSDIVSGRSTSKFVTGFNSFDAYMDIPMEGKFIAVPGRENTGKSAFLRNLAVRMMLLNKDIRITYFTLDDDIKDTIRALIAVYANYKYLSNYGTENPEYIVTINMVKKLQYYKNGNLTKEEMNEVPSVLRSALFAAYDEIYDLIINKQTLAIYGSVYGREYENMHKIVAQSMNEMPNHNHIVFLDNFYDMEGSENDEGIKRLLKEIKDKFFYEFDVPLVSTMELRKENGKNTRPNVSDIRDTSKIGYVLNLALVLHNDSHINTGSFMKFKHDVINLQMEDELFPVVEMTARKNKITSFKGTLLYRFYPSGSLYLEIDKVKHKSVYDTLSKCLKKQYDERPAYIYPLDESQSQTKHTYSNLNYESNLKSKYNYKFQSAVESDDVKFDEPSHIEYEKVKNAHKDYDEIAIKRDGYIAELDDEVEDKTKDGEEYVKVYDDDSVENFYRGHVKPKDKDEAGEVIDAEVIEETEFNQDQRTSVYDFNTESSPIVNDQSESNVVEGGDLLSEKVKTEQFDYDVISSADSNSEVKSKSESEIEAEIDPDVEVVADSGSGFDGMVDTENGKGTRNSEVKGFKTMDGDIIYKSYDELTPEDIVRIGLTDELYAAMPPLEDKEIDDVIGDPEELSKNFAEDYANYLKREMSPVKSKPIETEGKPEPKELEYDSVQTGSVEDDAPKSRSNNGRVLKPKILPKELRDELKSLFHEAVPGKEIVTVEERNQAVLDSDIDDEYHRQVENYINLPRHEYQFPEQDRGGLAGTVSDWRLTDQRPLHSFNMTGTSIANKKEPTDTVKIKPVQEYFNEITVADTKPIDKSDLDLSSYDKSGERFWMFYKHLLYNQKINESIEHEVILASTRKPENERIAYDQLPYCIDGMVDKRSPEEILEWLGEGWQIVGEYGKYGQYDFIFHDRIVEYYSAWYGYKYHWCATDPSVHDKDTMLVNVVGSITKVPNTYVYLGLGPLLNKEELYKMFDPYLLKEMGNDVSVNEMFMHDTYLTRLTLEGFREFRKIALAADQSDRSFTQEAIYQLNHPEYSKEMDKYKYHENDKKLAEHIDRINKTLEENYRLRKLREEQENDRI